MPRADVQDSIGARFLGPGWATPRCEQGACAPMQDGRPVANATTWEVPYDGSQFDDGIDVDVAYRPTPVLPPRRIAGSLHSARNYDVGLCDVTIPFVALASQLNAAVFPKVLDGVLKKVSGLRDTSSQRAWAGALLSSNQSGASDDRVVLRLEQRVLAFSGPFTPEIIGAEQLTLTPALAVAGDRTLVRFDLNDVSPTFLYYRDRYLLTQDASNEIVVKLREDLAQQLSTAVNDSLRVMVELLGTPFGRCDPTMSVEQQRAACQSGIAELPLAARSVFAGLPSECVNFRQLGFAQQRSSQYRARYCELAAASDATHVGFCAARINPVRIQVLPDGIQIVLLDSDTDPRASIIRNTVIPAAARVPGLRATCDTQRLAAQDPTQPRTELISVSTEGESAQLSCSASATASNSCAALISSSAPPALPTCGG